MMPAAPFRPSVRLLFTRALVLAVVWMAGCRPDEPTECKTPPGATALEIDIPPFFPPMDIPPDNPTTVDDDDWCSHTTACCFESVPMLNGASEWSESPTGPLTLEAEP